MNDINVMEQSLMRVKRLRDDWIIKGYDTPQTTWQEQLEQYEELIERIKNDLKERKEWQK